MAVHDESSCDVGHARGLRILRGDVLLSGHLTAFVVAKIALTYLVPFSVSTYSALAANRLPANQDQSM
jgi:hypothetical protein